MVELPEDRQAPVILYQLDQITWLDLESFMLLNKVRRRGRLMHVQLTVLYSNPSPSKLQTIDANGLIMRSCSMFIAQPSSSRRDFQVSPGGSVEQTWMAGAWMLASQATPSTLQSSPSRPPIPHNTRLTLEGYNLHRPIFCAQHT